MKESIIYITCDACGKRATNDEAYTAGADPWSDLTFTKRGLQTQPVGEKNLCPACYKKIQDVFMPSKRCDRCGSPCFSNRMWGSTDEGRGDIFCGVSCEYCSDGGDKSFEMLCDDCIDALCTHLTPKKGDTPNGHSPESVNSGMIEP